MRTNPDLVLFKEKVYATEADATSFGEDILYFKMLEEVGDDIHYIIREYKEEIKRPPVERKVGFYLPDETITQQRQVFFRSLGKMSSRHYDFECSRKVIVDDRYPVYFKYSREFKRWTGKRKMALMFGDYQITFGRRYLVDMLGNARYEKALSELTEIVIHDNHIGMKISSLNAIRDIRSTKTSIFLKKILEENSDQTLFPKILSLVEDFPDTKLLPSIRKLLEENYYYFPQDYLEALTKSTIQQTVLTAVSNIRSTKVFEVLKLGVESPYEHVEQTALNCIRTWARTMTEEIVRKNMDTKTANFISKILKTYDVRVYDKSYTALRKMC